MRSKEFVESGGEHERDDDSMCRTSLRGSISSMANHVDPSHAHRKILYIAIEIREPVQDS